MAKLAASEAATAIAHQVITSIDISNIQHAESESALSHQQVLGEGGLEFIIFI